MELETIQIHLNSRNADNYIDANFSNCEFYLPSIECPQQHHIYVSVVSASIPYTFYNIDTTNNYLVYKINGSFYYLWITSGNYNAIQFASYLTSNTGLNVSYNIITNKLSLTHSTYSFSLGSSSTCLELLGFKTSNNTSQLSSYYNSSTTKNEMISLYCVNLQSKHCICIQTNFETGNRNFAHLRSSSILASIPISGQPYSMITYTNPNRYRANLFTNSIRYINIKLVNQMNELVDLNGCHFTITLQLDIEKFVY